MSIIDDSGPDRINIKCVYTTNQELSRKDLVFERNFTNPLTVTPHFFKWACKRTIQT